MQGVKVKPSDITTSVFNSTQVYGLGTWNKTIEKIQSKYVSQGKCSCYIMDHFYKIRETIVILKIQFELHNSKLFNQNVGPPRGRQMNSKF